MTAFYNEIDPYCAQWLRNLIAAGHIAPGVVDERSIEDITPNELVGYSQCHFFAGVGVWSYALRLAGWPDDRPVWTGSCPCQPFSAAGKGRGFADERHLWPAWLHLIRERRPGVVFGEQVASRDGLGWLDLVQADLEGADYACGAVDLCAAGVGAPHIRQRLWFVANAVGQPCERNAGSVLGTEAAKCGAGKLHGRLPIGLEHGGPARGMANANAAGLRSSPRRELHDYQHHAQPRGAHGSLADASDHGLQGRLCGRAGPQGEALDGPAGCDGATRGHWAGADWVYCRDGKFRPVEPGTFPLAYGVANRVGRLRAYGNAINAEAAAAVIRAYMDTRP